MQLIEIKELLSSHSKREGEEVVLVGGFKSIRSSAAIGFIAFSDGTSLETIQIVFKKENIANFDEISKLNLASTILVKGIVRNTPDKKQPFEIQASKILVLKEADASYPLQKKAHGPEFLRENAHLRPRTNKFYAIMKIRSELANAFFEFFKNNDFLYVHAPIITSNDAEGAGESFEVISANEPNYFNKKASLTVSGQFASEAYSQAFKRVFTFGPTFRAEKSHTSKHLSEFWMIEPEVSLMDLEKLTILMEQCIKHAIYYLFEYARPELEWCNENLEPGLIEKLNNVVNNEFARVEYRQAIEILKKAVAEGVNFEVKDIEFGMDLKTEHERYICEKVYKAPVFIVNYPKAIKAFYMKQNDDNLTVAATDLLAPGIGEICGGSQREDSYNKLLSRCLELDLDPEFNNLQWYLDLRKYGYYRSAGFGLGFDRLLMYVTGCDNIRDAIPFPRFHGQLDF
ncbi:asparagine--tRNA ligase [Mycoplasma sp. T363T]|uniref:asparagine--tRNA ligase n=1 Tax=Mycoplasma bradburyae TaxID=2963128 RepID=UPI00233FB614|nr:asparagine--tRNA ligase [Mycoplasma bradburyae]MDC4163298.1 asparagine--tRNA ligase [Mycoplasma bradburyae]MDC4182617.1 asparagine--tRNA ligase [Mycoplasma bradburyae]MDC4184096.1 asparagine--tRNA ligase [Mycoplasma bradburyae]